MFDLNGFIVCRGLLSPEEVAELNAAIDRHADEIGWFQRTVPPPPLPTPHSPLRFAGIYWSTRRRQGATGSTDGEPLAGAMGYNVGAGRNLPGPPMLGWPEPADRDPFRRLMCHPRLCRFLNTLCGRGFRLDHPPSLRVYNPGAGTPDDPLNLHGSSGPDFNPAEYYLVRNGRPHSGLTVVAWQLADIGPGDGGFGCLIGSHKGK